MTGGRYAITSLCVALAWTTLPASAKAAEAQVWFWNQSTLTSVPRSMPAAGAPLESVLNLLLAGPTPPEQQLGLTSSLPVGTGLVGIKSGGDKLELEFTKEILAGISVLGVEQIYRQVSRTVLPYYSTQNLELVCGGQLLADYLPAAPQVKPTQQAFTAAQSAITTGSLSGKSITLSPGHGYFWNGAGYATQRPVYCSPLLDEDAHNVEICQYLNTYLLADGMNVKPARCLDKNYGTHLPSTKEWWQMSAYLWLENLGYPCSVFSADTGDCLTGRGSDERSDDIYSRPLASNFDGTDIYISVHTNGYGGNCTGPSCPTGTEMYYDASSTHAAWGAASQTLANEVSSNFMSTITQEVDSTWTCTTACVKNSNGAYGEIRLPQRPAILVELGYHDTCDRDADTSHLRDNFFRSAMMWGVYKGVCSYFGAAPTWDFYSCEYLGDNIPYTLQPGESRNVSITFRNRGVLWKSARGFNLGAVDDSDPLRSSNRVAVAGEVGPGQQFTFSFTLNAPSTPGYYTTDWQMVREGYAWFGPVVSRVVQVGNPPTMLLSDDFEAYADQAALEATWTNTGGCEYVLDNSPSGTGKAIRMPSPSNTGKFVRNLGRTLVGTNAEPLVFEFDLYLPTLGGPNWEGTRHYCDLRGYSGGAYGAGTLANLVSMGLNDTSSDAYSTTRFQGAAFVDGTRQWYTLDGPAAPARAPGWHTMRVRITSNQFDYYIDGVLSESVARVSAAGFNCIVLGSGLTANGHEVFVDNVKAYLDSQPPMVTQQPASTAICLGGSAILSIQAIGQALSYQWQYNESDLSDGGRVAGAKTNTLSITSFDTADTGNYRCIISNAAGTVVSNAAALTVRPASSIIQQPQALGAPMGGEAVFTVGVSSSDPVTYQWRRNGVPLIAGPTILGVNEPTLQFTDVRADTPGTYTCTITTSCGVLSSNGATLSLTTVPGDYNGDGDVDMQDFALLQVCLTGPSVPVSNPACYDIRLDQDNDVDQLDVEYFLHCLSGPDVPGTPACAGAS